MGRKHCNITWIKKIAKVDRDDSAVVTRFQAHSVNLKLMTAILDVQFITNLALLRIGMGH